MIIKDIEQGSQEWKELRTHSIGASDIAAIMDKDPYCTPLQKWEEKVFGKEREVTSAMERGRSLEPIVRDWFSDNFMSVKPIVAQSQSFDWMIASLDGYSDKPHPVSHEHVIVEIKCCNKEYYAQIAENRIPDHYNLQMQWQMMVTNLSSCHLIAYDGERPNVVIVHRNPALQEKMVQAAKEFYLKNMLEFQAPAATERDIVERNDTPWALSAIKWREAKCKRKDAEEEEAECLKYLVELCKGQSTKGAGITVKKITREGSIDYKKIPALEGINLDEFRKKPVEYWQANEVKE